ncbi:MAG: hypothetical protein OEU93_10700 [Rubrivivax sp.]|nr:hypothetical protein [Rubrivivax sp.]
MSAGSPDPGPLHSPYPGLRPFRDDEAAVFFGRDSQVEELLKRMASQHFVVVLGGSGSGKSSLIKAGVIPALRSYQLRDAGDVWVPVVATPGTNLASSDIPEDRRSSPIDRLAAKLAAALSVGPVVAPDGTATDATKAIARRLRQHDGLQRVYEEFVPQTRFDGVTSPAALDALRERTNLLIVLDQFEELFHPSNTDVEDCERLVQRVLEHHLDAHPRMYLMLTMRSEYLNDCAKYLKLPDAINTASYLVRRLSPFEIGQVIALPAQHYATLMANQAGPDDPPLPRRIEFQPEVLARLKADVATLYGNPDHLPLLQHLLARLWDAACARAQAAGAVLPERITVDDLLKATVPDAAAEAKLPEGNLPYEAVEQWARHVWQTLGERDRQIVDELLPLLAYKDPNTGREVQRRVRAEDGAALLGPDGTTQALHAVVRPYLAPLDYLFWDDDDPAAVTLKVSHESFIRGWARFRWAVSREADRFSDFLAALRSCEEWVKKGRGADGLLPADLLDNFAAYQYDPAREADAQPLGREWLRLLGIKNDGRRWLNVVGELPALASASRAAIEEAERRRQEAERRQQEAERRRQEAERQGQEAERQRLEGARRNKQRLMAGGLATLAIAGVAAKYWSTSNWLDDMYRALHAANTFALIDQNNSSDELVCRLERSEHIAKDYVDASDGTAPSRWIASVLPGRDAIDTAQLLVAEGVGRMLDQTLDRLVVPIGDFALPSGTVQTSAEGSPPAGGPQPVLPDPDSYVDASSADRREIQVIVRSPPPPKIDPEALPSGSEQTKKPPTPPLEFWASNNNKNCLGGDIFYSLPPGSQAAFDKSLRFLIQYTTTNDRTTAFLNRLIWRVKEDASCPSVRVVPLIRLSSEAYPRLAEPPRRLAEFLDSRRVDGRVEIQLAPDRLLSLVDLEPRLSSAPLRPGTAVDVQTESEGASGCNGLAPATIGVLMHRGEDWSRSSICDPYKEAAAGASSGPASSPAGGAALETSRMATLRLPTAMETALRAQKGQWFRGTGDRDGWLLFKADKADKATWEVPASIEARHKQLRSLLTWAKDNGTRCGPAAR